MARPSAEFATAVTLSTLDRLIDEDPTMSVEVMATRSHSVRQLKEGVRRDLEWLLNTRRIAEPPDESLKELNGSGPWGGGAHSSAGFSLLASCLTWAAPPAFFPAVFSRSSARRAAS